MRRQKEGEEEPNGRKISFDFGNLALGGRRTTSASLGASVSSTTDDNSRGYPRLQPSHSSQTAPVSPQKGALYPSLDGLPQSIRALDIEEDHVPSLVVGQARNGIKQEKMRLFANPPEGQSTSYPVDNYSNSFPTQHSLPMQESVNADSIHQGDNELHQKQILQDPPGKKDDSPRLIEFAATIPPDNQHAASTHNSVASSLSSPGSTARSVVHPMPNPQTAFQASQTLFEEGLPAVTGGARPPNLYGKPSLRSVSLEDEDPTATATYHLGTATVPIQTFPKTASIPPVLHTRTSLLGDDDDFDDDDDNNNHEPYSNITNGESADWVPSMLPTASQRFQPTMKRQVFHKKTPPPPTASSSPLPDTLGTMESNDHKTTVSSATRVPALRTSPPTGATPGTMPTLKTPPIVQSPPPAPPACATLSAGSAGASSSSSSSSTIQSTMPVPVEPSGTAATTASSLRQSFVSSPLKNTTSLRAARSHSPPNGEATTLEAPANETEEEKQLRLATEASLKETKVAPDDKHLTEAMVEAAAENARTLQQICRQGQEGTVDPSILEYYLNLCRQDQERIEQSGMGNFPLEKVDRIFTVSDMLLTAIQSGQTYEQSVKKPALAVTESLAIISLVAKKDIFSLICMLRAHQDEQRLEAAMALTHFARNAEKETASEEDRRLRNEIISSGGLHSLLTLFRSRSSMYELKVVVALAIAYILPSFVMSSSTVMKPGLGLKIMECLRFLSQARDVTPCGEKIGKEESFRAAAIGLTTFWVNQLEPMVRVKGEAKNIANSDHLARTPLTGHRRGRSVPGHVFDQRKEAIGTQELLEMTVSLIIEFASHSSVDVKENEIDPVLMVEQICAVEAARPIAVREGILKILVDWIEHGGNGRKRQAAADSLRYLTSIQDKYMAGWIHSQMVNEGALPAIVRLTRDQSLGLQVRLAIAQILSSLCVAPHTRAAVVEAECIHFLADILFEHVNSEDVAMFAAQALLQLAAGAITRASALGGDDMQSYALVSPDKRDKVVDDIVERGAIGSLVDIALAHKGPLRAVAIESLRVLSEDISPKRKTRLKLCDDGAARAVGASLNDMLTSVEGSLRMGRNISDSDMRFLHEALCVLSNVLDPWTGTMGGSKTRNSRQVSDPCDPNQLLVSACSQMIESGGLDSLIRISLLPLKNGPSYGRSAISTLDLIAEACQSISSLSPLLLAKGISSKGLSGWASDVFLTLDYLLQTLSNHHNEVGDHDSVVDIHVSALLGISALAGAAPLKIRIIDRILPHLLEAKNSQDQRDISNASSQAFQSLGFAEDEVALQVAGNSPALLADWFCLQRSLLIQAMARQEIHDTVLKIWETPFKESSFSAGPTRLIREVSDRSKSDDDKSLGSYFFESMVFDDIPVNEIQDILQQYDDMFGGERPKGDHTQILDDSVAISSQASWGLLRMQIYPLQSTATETDWLLRHSEYKKATVNETGRLSDHVEKLLVACFPSSLIRHNVLPIKSLRPDASFNFRALMMPQRRYFSFRREGQLLSRICGKEDETENIHWTLGFTNSSFAGEFGESLVQALYLCPMVCGLSFSRDHQWYSVKKSQEEGETGTDDGVVLLGNIVGSVPPWITNLTFDGILGDKELKSLVKILDTMGKLSAGQRSQISPAKEHTLKTETSNNEGQEQGRFWSFSVRNCPHLTPETWHDFFGLIGKVGRASKSPARRPLSSLRVLDLNGNGLGDELCASLLELILDKESGCKLEQLDLSSNRLANATRTLKALRSYVQYHRSDNFQGVKTRPRSWHAPLHTLCLGYNGLHLCGAWLEIVTLLKNNALPLKTLDLSGNKITLNGNSYETETFLSCLQKNTSLVHLDLSDNRVSHDTIDDMFGRLVRSTVDVGLAFLDMSNNDPPLTEHHKSMLKSLSARSRAVLIQRMITEKEELSRISTVEASEVSVSCASEFEPSGYSADDDPSSFMAMYPSNDRDNRRPTAPGDNMITVLFSAPLVYKDKHGSLRPFAKLDFDMERELIMQCLKEASRDIELNFDTATHHRLLAAISKGCRCLHYSGHGHEKFLPFEDGSGGPHWFEVDNIKSLISGREGGAPFRFVFVSACYSGLAGETFASAGVPHVVCCKQQFELKDTAALAFTRQFYLALAVGHTVKEAFEQGRKAVRATPNLRDAVSETEKFILLPRDGNHDVPIFDAPPLLQWPHATQHSRKKRSKTKGTLSIFNKMQNDPSTSPPQFFLGREVDMYLVLNLVLEKRLVSVVGDPGVGRSSLVCALCHYVNERATTISKVENILYVKARQSRKQSRVRALVQKLIKRLVDIQKIDPKDADTSSEADIESLFDIICQGLRDTKCLIVFDRTELLRDSDETREFPMLLSNLFRETRHVRVLLTGREPLGIPSIGGQVEHHFCLGPLTYANTVRLFSNLCPYIHTPAERRRLFGALVNDSDEADLLSSDPGLSERTRKVFSLLGNGIPARIEKAAYVTTKEDVMMLMSGSNISRLATADY